MSPIDDELRAALHGRAQVLAPASDPLAGIERRARRIRRNRVAASVAGSALAVAAIAAAVPVLQSATSSAPRQAQFATTPPSAQPTAAPSGRALDPERPWAYRGIPLEQLGEGTVGTITDEYATKRGVADPRVTLTPLFGQRYEPADRVELVFLADVDGELRWGVAQSSEAGPEFLWDEALPDEALALAAALPGDEVARLLVVAAPEADELSYGAGDTYSTMAQLAPGVGVAALERDPAADRYLVLVQGEEIHRADAPDLPAQPEPVDEGEAAVVPQGYGWDPADPWAFRGRGEPDGDLAVQDERLFAERHGSGWTSRPLYAAESDAGVSLLFVLHTKDGEADLVSTTWQVGDGPAEYADQVVDPGQGLVQHAFPTQLDDGDLLLVALASPRAGGIVLTGEKGNRPDGIGDKGVGLWTVDRGEDATVRLYTEGDGVEYLVEPARTS